MDIVEISITDSELESLEDGIPVGRAAGNERATFKPSNVDSDEVIGRVCNVTDRTINRLRDGQTVTWSGLPNQPVIELTIRSEQPRGVEINHSSEPDVEPTMQDLLNALVLAFGDELPDFIGEVERDDSLGERTYELYSQSNNLGNEYGRILASHGWVVVGVHTDNTGIDYDARFTVKQLSDIDTDKNSGIMYDDGDEARVNFDPIR